MAYSGAMARRALAASGALLGALGGVAAGTVDFVLAHQQAATFLPSGQARLWAFLASLYGAFGALAGLLLALIAIGLGRATDLGALWRAAFSSSESEGGRWVAYAIAASLALAGLGWFADVEATFALAHFHNRFLIAALVGASVAGMAIAGVAAVFLVAALLSLVVKVGPRVKLRLQAPPAIALAGWLLGVMGAMGGITLLLLSLQQRYRMPARLKALNTALWTPAIVLGALVGAHFVARLVGKRVRARVLFTPGGALGLGALALALPFAVGAAAEWATVRQLDGRPWAALLVALVLSLGLGAANAAHRLDGTRPLWRAIVAVALPVLLLSLALDFGRSDRVRKSATAFTGATAPLVQLLHAATDLDRDGYSSVLGGGDCNDFDRSVHPGAFDWPDDGVDQNCNGHQATLAPTEKHAWARVPDSVPKDLNVLLLTIDALRADHVGAYGYPRPTTPNLDALAKESIFFENGWAHAPSTRYSVPAILTGRYPSTIPVGNANWPPNLLPENRLISEILKDNGYKTAALLSYHYFNTGWGLNQGFDDYDYHLQTLHSIGGDPAATQGSSARELADLDVKWIQDHKDQKFFLWSHFYDTHFMFARHAEPETHFGNSELDLYDGEIRFTDMQLGRVFDALKQAGLWDKTIIIITADHGDGFGEHGIPKNQRHGYHLYRNETKVPMLIRIPGLPPRVVKAPTGHIDLLPTLLNALRIPREPQLLGESVLGQMTGEAPDQNRRVFQEVWYEGPTSRKAVVDENWHLIRNLVPDDTTELYDLQKDPAEDHDRAGQGETAERDLGAALGEWMDQAALPPHFAEHVAGNVSDKPLAFTTPLGDRIGGWLELAGVDVVTPTVQKNGQAEVDLYLHGLGEIPEGWILFTHFVSARGRMINADHTPLEGAFPLERIHAGLWLRDKIKVSLPPGWPPGPVTVEVGLWQRGRQAPAKGAHSTGGTVHVATLQVQ